MSLKKLATITWVVIAISLIARLGLNFDNVLRIPFRYALSSVEPLALIFFFFMLARHTGDE